MYKFQVKCTLHEMNVIGTDFAGCVHPIRGRMICVMKELRKRLGEIDKRDEEVICIQHKDLGEVLIKDSGKDKFVFVSHFTILTNKDEHSCPNRDKCTIETRKLLDMANV